MPFTRHSIKVLSPILCILNVTHCRVCLHLIRCSYHASHRPKVQVQGFIDYSMPGMELEIRTAREYAPILKPDLRVVSPTHGFSSSFRPHVTSVLET